MLHQNPSPQKIRNNLETSLTKVDGEGLQKLFQDKDFNAVFIGASALQSCNQGTFNHLEGDVAVHTAMVFEKFKELAPRRLGREASFVELVSVVMHDLRKPQTRMETEPGKVSFPGHEIMGAKEVPEIAPKIGLSSIEAEELYFLVACHGEAHGWRELSEERKSELQRSPWIAGLALLQEADARSCLVPGGGHLPVYWDEIVKG